MSLRANSSSSSPRALQHAPADEGASRALGELLDARQRRDLVDHVVEGVVGAPSTRRRASSRAPRRGASARASRAVSAAKRSSAASRRARSAAVMRRRGLGGREALELGADQERLAQLGGRDRAHAHAAVGHRRDEAERLESLQRLAHRGAADAEALADVLLAQHLPRRDRARDDLVLERRGRCRQPWS